MTEWPTEFDILATYNTEVRRGIVHTPEWKVRMADLQASYHEWCVENLPGYISTTGFGVIGIRFHRGSFTY